MMKLDKTVEVQRLIADESPAEDSESYTTHIADLRCHIQPLEEGFSPDLEGDYTKDFLMFCNVCDIIENDRVVEGSDIYIVGSVDKFNFLGRSHLEVILRKIK